jgi:uncharacterized Fe-S center protein
LGSTDPVALDQACYDLVKEHKGNKTRMWEYFDKGAITLKYSEEIGTGTRDYKLIKL